MELEEADCLELWCLKQPGYFLSSDCSLLMFKHQGQNNNGCQWMLSIREHLTAIYFTFYTLSFHYFTNVDG